VSRSCDQDCWHTDLVIPVDHLYDAHAGDDGRREDQPAVLERPRDHVAQEDWPRVNRIGPRGETLETETETEMETNILASRSIETEILAFRSKSRPEFRSRDLDRGQTCGLEASQNRDFNISGCVPGGPSCLSCAGWSGTPGRCRPPARGPRGCPGGRGAAGALPRAPRARRLGASTAAGRRDRRPLDGADAAITSVRRPTREVQPAHGTSSTVAYNRERKCAQNYSK